MILLNHKYRCEMSFSCEGHSFHKGEEYILTDILEEDPFTIYIFNNKILFGDIDNDFNEYFISLERERIRNLQKIVFG